MKEFSSLHKTFFFLLLAVLSACAQIRGLEGGKKDETPAAPIGISPAPLSTFFHTREIRIDFDEYVQLNNVNQELIVSPPLKKPVKATVRKKSVFVELQEDLLPNTTYTFNFGDAIVDINENNKTPLIYVVSTGEVIDSLLVKGRAINAWTGEPMKGAKVMLYSDMGREHLFKDQPSYFGRVDASGQFEIPYLASGDYQIVVLDDANGNYHLEEGELVATQSEAVSASQNDSTNLPLSFFLSNSLTERPIVTDYKADSLGVLRFPFPKRFGLPVVRKLKDSSPNFEVSFNPNEDSVYVWLKGKATDGRESLQIAWRDSVMDTVDIPFFSEAQNMKWAPLPGFGKKVMMDKALILNTKSFSEIKNSQLASVKTDSTLVDVTIERDPLWPSRFLLKGPWKQGKNYELLVLPGALENGGGILNDTLKASFSIFKPEDLGQIDLSLEGPDGDGPFILHITNARSQVVYHEKVSPSTTVVLKNLEAGDYIFRLIRDANNNNEWDPISYSKGLDAEEVFIYSGKVSARANWEVKLKWQVKH